MKTTRVLGLMLLLLTLVGCSAFNSSNSYSKDKVVVLIEEYINENKLIKLENSAKSTDIPELSVYTKDDFVNYDLKPSKNIDIEYDYFFEEFAYLETIEATILANDDFSVSRYFYSDDQDVAYYVNILDDVLSIEYYLYSNELNLVERQSFRLSKIDDEVYMEKYVALFNGATKEYIREEKITVYKGHYIETMEYSHSTNSYKYELNSKEDQISFVYEYEVDSSGNDVKERIEHYYSDTGATVEYEIDNGIPGDYKVKFHNNGHRILKLDVNISNTSDDINELTWNLLEVDGWDTAKASISRYKMYVNDVETMTDYDISIQQNGYGKIVANTVINGTLFNQDITLSKYGLESGITLQMIEDAKSYYLDNYIDNTLEFGFVVGSNNNLDILKDEFKEFSRVAIMNDFISKNTDTNTP